MVKLKPEDDMEIPKYMKYAVYIVDKVGFPALAFIMMFWMAFCSLEKATKAIESNTQALLNLSQTTLEFREQANANHARMDAKIDTLIQKELN